MPLPFTLSCPVSNRRTGGIRSEKATCSFGTACRSSPPHRQRIFFRAALSAPKSQRFLRFAIAMPIADPRNRLRFQRQDKAMLHCDLRVRWKVAGDLRFRVAISEPKTTSLCRISADLAHLRGSQPTQRETSAKPREQAGFGNVLLRKNFSGSMSEKGGCTEVGSSGVHKLAGAGGGVVQNSDFCVFSQRKARTK